MEYVRCNFCNSSNLKFVTKSKDFIHKISDQVFSIVECKKCGLNFTNPRPTISEINKYYSSHYSFFKNDNPLKSFFRIFLLGYQKKLFYVIYLIFYLGFEKKLSFILRLKKLNILRI